MELVGILIGHMYFFLMFKVRWERMKKKWGGKEKKNKKQQQQKQKQKQKQKQ